MNIQTERLENHTARFTVEVGNERFDKAKQEAARKLAKQYRIPGFRKGKAPYNVLVRYLGEAPIIEEAIELLGNQIYLEALRSDDTIQPYTSGTLEDFKLEPEPTYTFSVPLEPEVTLGDYRAIRRDFEIPTISDEDVEDMLENFRQRFADVEESEEPVALHNRVTVDIHSEFVDGEERPSNDDATNEEDTDPETITEVDGTDEEEKLDDESPVIYKGDSFIHQHSKAVDLNPEKDPVLKGFSEALVGANVGDDVEFELTVPDEDTFEGVVGRKVKFNVGITKIEKVALPALDDDLAVKATEDDEEPLQTLDELRSYIRTNMQKEAEEKAEIAFADEILEEIVVISTVHYPQQMVDERIEDMLQELDGNLRQQGIGIDDYIRMTGQTKDALKEVYRPRAQQALTRSLVLGQVLASENIIISPDDIEAEIDKMLAQFGEQREIFRQYLDTPQYRNNVLNNLLYQQVMTRLAKIGRGETIEEPTPVETTTPADVEANDEPQAEIPTNSAPSTENAEIVEAPADSAEE